MMRVHTSAEKLHKTLKSTANYHDTIDVMKSNLHIIMRWKFSSIAFAIASLVLAYGPIVWLFNSWLDPSYQSTGAVYAIIVVCLIAWSASSKNCNPSKPVTSSTVTLLILSAFLRLASQIMAINILGGIALALDVFAITNLFKLSSRVRSVSAFWISVLFLFSLPFERIVQRLLGYPMQEVSAFGACQILGSYFDDLVCEGLRLQVQGKDVLVDLPCSGTQSLMLALAVFVTLNALYKPNFFKALIWGVLTILLSIIGNAVRISLLASGIVYQDKIGIDVMAQPTHSLIGYATLALSLIPLFWFYRPVKHSSSPQGACLLPTTIPYLKGWVKNSASVGFVLIAFLIVFLPRQAIDVSRKIPNLELPQLIYESQKQIQKLEPVEETYFKAYGGTAQKAIYGPMALTLVQTTSPLRHLHSPSDCLRGLGYKVTFIGSQFEPIPTAIYSAESQDGSKWRVAVTFLSNHGHATSNVAEAIWHWLKFPNSEWSSVQRITPWQLDDDTRKSYEHAVIAALDLPLLKQQ